MTGAADRTIDSVAITGASGFLGSALARSFEADGVEVHTVTRSASGAPNEIIWNPREGRIEAEKLEGIDAVVHLAGESIMGLWTPTKKERIYRSRVEGTSLLAETLAGLEQPPAVLVSASGVNYYGDSGDRVLTESDPPGDDFLARTCVEWEAATEPASAAGIRTVITRMGLVLDGRGGALQVMLPIFRIGLGGRLGDGQQWMSWVTLEDAVAAFRFVIDNRDIAGPVNVTSPNPVRNEDFTRALAKAVGMPALFVVPSFALKATGGMGEVLLLSSLKVLPSQLSSAGFHFDHAGLADGLRAALDADAADPQTV